MQGKIFEERDCMSLEGFCKAVCMDIQHRMGKQFHVSVQNVVKNNDVSLHGMTIMEKGCNLSPTIYLDGYYSCYQEGAYLTDIEERIMQCYEENKLSQSISTAFFTEWENVKHRIIFKLVNFERNRKMLEDVPHVRFLDLALVFQCFLGADTEGSATILIHNLHLKLWDVTQEELYTAAEQNTPELLKYEIRNMYELIQELLEKEELAKVSESGNTPCLMYVLTNQYKINGASALFYRNLLKDFADKTGYDLYILPSSVHEVILLPAFADTSMEELTQMVKEVNATQVREEEILADHAYKFVRETGEIIMEEREHE